MIDKKRKERHHLEKFLDSFKKENPSFSFGKELERREFDPKPDFLFEDTSVGKLGIEHTEVFKKEGKEKSTLQAVEAYQDKIVDEAKSIVCRDKNISPLSVEVWFNELRFRDSGSVATISMTNKNLKILSQKLAEFVRVNYSKVKEGQDQNFSGVEPLPELGLKDCFMQIVIRRPVSFKEHRWKAHKETGWVSRDTINRLQQTIDEKNKKFDEYIQKCDKCWLLVVGHSKASQFLIEPPCEHIFNSKFERIFYLRYLDNKLRELKASALQQGVFHKK